MDQSETDTDSETPMGHASIWVQTHTICYRPVPENDPCNYTRYQRYRLSKRFMFDWINGEWCLTAAPTRLKTRATIQPVPTAATLAKVKVLPAKIPVKRRATNSGTVSLIGFCFKCLNSDFFFFFLSLLEGNVPEMNSPLAPFLNMKLPECVTVEDPCLEVLNLLRIIHALNRYWGFLYQMVDYRPILLNQELFNTKLTAKANRQLQVPAA